MEIFDPDGRMRSAADFGPDGKERSRRPVVAPHPQGAHGRERRALMGRLVPAAIVTWSLVGVASATAEVSCPTGTHVARFGDAKKGEEWCVKDTGGGRHGPLHGWVRSFTIDGTFRDDKADGTFTGRSPNGRPAGEVVLRDGVAQGRLITWHDNGRLLGECTFTDGRVTTSLVLFDAGGRKRAVFEPVAGGQLQLAHVYDATGRETSTQRGLKEMRHTGTRRAE